MHNLSDFTKNYKYDTERRIIRVFINNITYVQNNNDVFKLTNYRHSQSPIEITSDKLEKIRIDLKGKRFRWYVKTKYFISMRGNTIIFSTDWNTGRCHNPHINKYFKGYFHTIHTVVIKKNLKKNLLNSLNRGLKYLKDICN